MNAPATHLVPAGQIDRRTYIGGSDIAAIMGLSPWKTPVQLYEEKVSEDAPTISEEKRKFFARRKRQEPVVAEMLMDTYGIEVTRLSLDANPNRYIDREFPFMAAEIDFEFVMSDAAREAFPERPEWCAIPDGTLLNGEIKTVHPFAAREWGEQGSEDVPVHYAAQSMFGLGVTRRPACLLAALFSFDSLLAFPVMADPVTIDGMRRKAVQFWSNHVLRRQPPEPINMADMMRLFAKTNGRPVEATDELRQQLSQLRKIRGSIAVYEQDKEDTEFAICDLIRRQWGLDDSTTNEQADNALITLDGVTVATWKKQSRTGIDSKALAADLPDVAKKYTRVSHFRSIRFPKSKGA